MSHAKRPSARRKGAPLPNPRLPDPAEVPRYVQLRRFLEKLLTDAHNDGRIAELAEIRLPDGEPEDEANSFGVVFEDGKLLVVEVMEP